MTPLYTAEQSRTLDRLAMEQGLPGVLLMKRAAFFAFEVLRRQFPHARKVVVVCGTGNNGGDGFALAQYAHLAGLEVHIMQLGQVSRIRGDALTMLHELSDLGLGGLPFDAGLLNEADVIVDALFGTGLDRPIEGDYAEAIQAINASATPVLALDVPSGLHADSGQVLGVAVKAAHTATFIGHKMGLHMEAGRELCGQIHFHDLGVPADIYATCPPRAYLTDWRDCPRPARPAFAHKGTAGTALLIGGAPDYPGAITLAAEGAMRAGAGYVRVVSDAAHHALLLARQPALLLHGADSLPLDQADAVGIGPGLGRSDWSRKLFRQVLHWDGPRVLDADALTLLADTPSRSDNWILTPHPGEAARLLGTTAAQVQGDRLSTARTLQRRFGGVIVLKGAGTVIDDGTDTYICGAGNAGMATAGMGDVLTGVITALLAQGLSPADAARSGVCLHAAAGDLATARHGRLGLDPTQLLPFIQHLPG
ncbi:NAD(P)H-hydrate dehydratase [Sulfurivirga sp.]|uniref:NAD(P)H-hydrate dehydratase n=1 Tax=Sulfurivirga sp. TaxID=2614236 RepID=UPI0025EE9E67|nr:NAD(P)H-hydrate dehydratase [Sulfurivirga sp.]